eukprot:TRINITY_DN1342_c2_g1_i1.p2 TRINITY_DN1342_c2_g1~~TRINITY_DN1342_c2_g1_i1.p2  ORF type:complete len:172 (+),score=54.71 TRINITY_DN1342_c2_g1_i1:60-575(+)
MWGVQQQWKPSGFGGGGKGWGGAKGSSKGWGASPAPNWGGKGWGMSPMMGQAMMGKGMGMMGKGMAMMGKGMKGKGKGKGKDRGPSGPNLARTRITTEPVTGEVKEWKGKYGWITPTVPIDHPEAAKRSGSIYVSMTDIQGGLTQLTQGSLCQFHVFTDASGLGAEEVIGS